MKGLESITYEFNGRCLNISLGEVVYISYGDILETIERGKILQYVRSLYSIISDWEHDYNNVNLIDGNNWKLSIIYADGNKSEYSGKSNYPYNFGAFERLNQKLIMEVLNGKIY